MANTEGKKRTVAFLPYLLCFLTALFIIGVIFPEKEIWGSLLGALAAVLIWLLTYAKDRIDEERRIERFREIIWGELFQFTQALIQEMQLWETVHEEISARGALGVFAPTTPMGIDQYQLVLLNANLDRVTEFEVEVTDALAATLAGIRNLFASERAYYNTEKEMARRSEQSQGTARHSINAIMINEAQAKNSLDMAIQIARLVDTAIEAYSVLDHSGRYIEEAEKKSILRTGKFLYRNSTSTKNS